MATTLDVDQLTPEQLYERLAEVDVALPTLTDEELAAVSPPPAQRPYPVALPRVERLEPAVRDATLETALRGLAARRWIRLAHEDEPGRVVATGSLGLLLGLRQHPAALAVVERMVEGRTHARHLHVARDGWTVLEEQRHAGGQHTFLLRTLPRAAAAIAAATDPGGWARGDGPPLVYERGVEPAGWDHVDRAVAGAEVVTRITTLVGDGARALRAHVSVVASRSFGVWALSGADERVTAVPVGPARLPELVAACLTPDPVDQGVA